MSKISVLKYWNSTTFDVTNHKWPLRDRINKSFTTSGSDNTSINTYTYNELGFRGNSLPLTDDKLMAIGCSHTEGIGVNDDETWPHYLSNLLNYSHINFGFTGRSNDYIARCIISHVDEINPNLICIMYTYPSRREYYNNINGVEPFHTSPWGWFDENEGEYESMINLSNPNDDFINWYKNHLLITNYLQNKKIPYIWNGIFLNTDYDDGHRFDGNYDIKVDAHATPNENQTYATKLYTELINKNYGRQY